MLNRAGSAVQMPATSGWTRRSKASRPSRRRANDSRDSSPDSPAASGLGGTFRSARSRDFPAAERISVASIPAMAPGARRRKPLGTGRVRPARKTSARRAGSWTLISSSRSPSRSTSAIPSGRAARKLSALRSISQPSRRIVSTTPPARLWASTRITSGRQPLGQSPASRSDSAATSPASPPPTTTIRGGWAGKGDVGSPGGRIPRVYREKKGAAGPDHPVPTAENEGGKLVWTGKAAKPTVPIRITGFPSAGGRPNVQGGI